MMRRSLPSFDVVRRLGLAVVAAVLASAPPASAADGSARPGVPDSALAVFDGGAVYPAEFIRLWSRVLLTQRPPGPIEAARADFLTRIVDRKVLSAEVARRPFTPSPAEQRALDASRDRLVQNLLFNRTVADVADPTPAELELFLNRQKKFAMARFLVFSDWDRARTWRNRLLTGTPMSTFEAAVKREGPGLAVVDEFHLIGHEQLVDSMANVVWSLRPGQVTDVLSFNGHATLIHLQKFEVRPSAISADSDLNYEFKRRKYDQVRERERLRLAASVERRFEEDAMALLLAAHIRVPPRNDVDPVSGIPVVRPNLPLPTIAPSDTGRVLARTRYGDFTIADYLRFFARVEPYARTEIRDRGTLDGAVDRVVLDAEILREGLAQGLDRDSSVVAQLAQQREGFALDAFFREEIEQKVVVREKEIRALWQKDPVHYNDVPSLEAHEIAVERKSEADSLLQRLHDGASFEALAREHSTISTVFDDNGKTGVIFRGSQRNAGLENSMFATEIGALGGPEFTPEGWVIWRVDSKTPGLERTFEQAREMVERDTRILAGERLLQKRLAELRKKAHAKLFPERLAAALKGNNML